VVIPTPGGELVDRHRQPTKGGSRAAPRSLIESATRGIA
jgi:hypothetical protein